jgi:hypothetical protein
MDKAVDPFLMESLNSMYELGKSFNKGRLKDLKRDATIGWLGALGYSIDWMVFGGIGFILGGIYAAIAG